MAVKKSKKSAAEKPTEMNPMPSLVFHEAPLEPSPSATPKADQLEKELQETSRPPSLRHLASYNGSARKLMWFAVASLTLVVCIMWSWSIYFQISSTNWSDKSESNLLKATQTNWQRSFRDENGNPLTAEQQIEGIKQNLAKLLAGAAASSSTTSTPEVTTSTP